MPDVQSTLGKQAAWQRRRAQLPWAEKLRMAVILREAQRQLRGQTRRGSSSPIETRSS